MNPAIPAGRGQRMDCTLEAVERVGCAIHGLSMTMMMPFAK
jgi:hypothetical protein